VAYALHHTFDEYFREKKIEKIFIFLINSLGVSLDVLFLSHP